MTRQSYQQSKRLQPIGADGLEKIQSIVDSQRAAKINEVFIDFFTASAIVNVYNCLSEQNQIRLKTFCIAKVADICFKAINRAH